MLGIYFVDHTVRSLHVEYSPYVDCDDETTAHKTRKCRCADREPKMEMGSVTCRSNVTTLVGHCIVY